MRIVIISDTHTRHEELGVLSGDVLIHCGDGCNGFTRDPADVTRLDEWLGRQQFEAILCIGGNHDFHVERWSLGGGPVFENATYLEDQSFEFRGLHFYGAPWLPQLDGWAFYLDDAAIKEKWDLIPESTDVLITHTPPMRILDQNRRGHHCGCPELLARLRYLQLRLHCFGHNHASAGTTVKGNTRFVNASMVDSSYKIVRGPFVFDDIA